MPATPASRPPPPPPRAGRRGPAGCRSPCPPACVPPPPRSPTPPPRRGGKGAGPRRGGHRGRPAGWRSRRLSFREELLPLLRVLHQHLRGGEALAVLRLQRAEALHHVRRADGVHVPERSAAEGREA